MGFVLILCACDDSSLGTECTRQARPSLSPGPGAPTAGREVRGRIKSVHMCIHCGRLRDCWKVTPSMYVAISAGDEEEKAGNRRECRGVRNRVRTERGRHEDTHTDTDAAQAHAAHRTPALTVDPALLLPGHNALNDFPVASHQPHAASVRVEDLPHLLLPALVLLRRLGADRCAARASPARGSSSSCGCRGGRRGGEGGGPRPTPPFCPALQRGRNALAQLALPRRQRRPARRGVPRLPAPAGGVGRRAERRF